MTCTHKQHWSIAKDTPLCGISSILWFLHNRHMSFSIHWLLRHSNQLVCRFIPRIIQMHQCIKYVINIMHILSRCCSTEAVNKVFFLRMWGEHGSLIMLIHLCCHVLIHTYEVFIRRCNSFTFLKMARKHKQNPL